MFGICWTRPEANQNKTKRKQKENPGKCRISDKLSCTTFDLKRWEMMGKSGNNFFNHEGEATTLNGAQKANPPNCSGGFLLLANNRYSFYTVGAAAKISAVTPLAYFLKF
jgi:hypothetical protein